MTQRKICFCWVCFENASSVPNNASSQIDPIIGTNSPCHAWWCSVILDPYKGPRLPHPQTWWIKPLVICTHETGYWKCLWLCPNLESLINSTSLVQVSWQNQDINSKIISPTFPPLICVGHRVSSLHNHHIILIKEVISSNKGVIRWHLPRPNVSPHMSSIITVYAQQVWLHDDRNHHITIAVAEIMGLKWSKGEVFPTF